MIDRRGQRRRGRPAQGGVLKHAEDRLDRAGPGQAGEQQQLGPADLDVPVCGCAHALGHHVGSRLIGQAPQQQGRPALQAGPAIGQMCAQRGPQRLVERVVRRQVLVGQIQCQFACDGPRVVQPVDQQLLAAFLGRLAEQAAPALDQRGERGLQSHPQHLDLGRPAGVGCGVWGRGRVERRLAHRGRLGLAGGGGRVHQYGRGRGGTR